MTASAEKRQDYMVEFTAKWVEQIETLDHYLDGIIEDAATQEILYIAERRYA